MHPDETHREAEDEDAIALRDPELEQLPAANDVRIALEPADPHLCVDQNMEVDPDRRDIDRLVRVEQERPWVVHEVDAKVLRVCPVGVRVGTDPEPRPVVHDVPVRHEVDRVARVLAVYRRECTPVEEARSDPRALTVGVVDTDRDDAVDVSGRQ